MRDYNGRCAQCGLWNCHHLYTTSNTANGPQTERSGVPNPEPDGLVTVELTREEAENLEMSVTYGLSHTPSNPPDRRDLYCPTCRALASLRASLERTSK